MTKLFTAALGCAVAVLPVLGVTVATAQEDTTCETATANVLDLQAQLDAALVTAGEVLRISNPTVENVRQIVEAVGDSAPAEATTVLDLDATLGAAIGTRDTVCSEQPEPTGEPEPTDEPDPTPEPTPTTEPNDPPVDYDCDDFPLADGRTAQDVLEEDLNDPHALDEDGDLVACEADDPATGDNTGDPGNGGSGSDDDSGVFTPRGGVNTGVGPE